MRIRSLFVAGVVAIMLPGCARGGGQDVGRVEPGARTPVVTLLEGQWDWIDAEGVCTRNPFTITYDSTQNAIDLTYKLPQPNESGQKEPVQYIYQVLEQGSRHLRGQIVGETRMTASGEPVIWDFVVLSHELFCWARTDWELGGCTKPLVRCDAVPARVSSPTDNPPEAKPAAPDSSMIIEGAGS